MTLYHKKTGQALEVVLRPFRPGDAGQVISCIRDAYGGTYVNPSLYTEEGILRCQQSGELYFSVAETGEGQVAGVTACARSGRFPGLAEAACQVIRREYSGYGLALPLALHAMERAKALPVTGQYARALGCHLISQKTLKEMGFTACGFLLNVFDKEKFTHHFQNGSYAKIPQALAVKRQGIDDLGPLFLPSQLTALARRCFRELGVSWTPAPAGTPSGPDQWDREQDQVHASLSLWARTCGEGFGEHLAAALRPVSERPGQTVNLFLSLSRPGSAAAWAEARRQGFFFTGFLPCGEGGIYLIMHHPLQVPVRLDGIPCLPEYAPFLDEIRRQL